MPRDEEVFTNRAKHGIHSFLGHPTRVTDTKIDGDVVPITARPRYGKTGAHVLQRQPL